MRRKGQLNWADLTSLLIILTGALGGLAGPRRAKAGAVTTILCVFGGLLVGWALAVLSSISAYSVLNSKRLAVGVALVGYFFLPMLFMAGTFLLVNFLLWLVAHLF